MPLVNQVSKGDQMKGMRYDGVGISLKNMNENFISIQFSTDF